MSMRYWSAHVEWVSPDLTEEQTDAMVDDLRLSHPSMSGPDGQGRCGATITVPAGTLRQAVAVALSRVEAAAAAAGVRVVPDEVHAQPEEVRDGRLEVPLLPELVGVAEVAGLLQVTQQRASPLIRDRADFPRPVAQLASGPVFTAASVGAFDRRWTRRPGRPPKVSAEAGA